MVNSHKKTAFVYGLGRTGIVTAEYLAERGYRVLVWDDRAEADLLKNENIKAVVEEEDINLTLPEMVNWKHVDLFVKSPGIPMENKLVVEVKEEHGIAITTDIDLLYRREQELSSKSKFIGITGTNGKSTTTALIAHILQENGYSATPCGNIGKAALATPKGLDYYVVEVSSYQLEMVNEMQFDIAVLLNLAPDHLERHGTIGNYLRTKERIFSNQPTSSKRVIGVDDKELMQIAPRYKAEGINCSLVSINDDKSDVFVDEYGCLYHHTEKHGLAKVGDLSKVNNLPGRHNWQNIASAYAALSDLVDENQFMAALATFKSLPHRLEKVHKLGKIEFYNDSKATNPESANRALESLHNIYWIVGGRAKDEGIKPCLNNLSNVRATFVIGECAEQFKKNLDPLTETTMCGTLNEAVHAAYLSAKTENLSRAIVLLAPACASWDQFKSFEHRGDTFVTLCHNLDK